jgi:hypothetical protein
VTRKPPAVLRKPTNLPNRSAQDRTGVDGGGSVGGRLGIWALLAGITGAGVAVALRRSKTKADDAAAAADRGAAVPGGAKAAASFKAEDYASPPAHVSMTDAEYEYDRHGASVLGSAHPAPGAGHARSNRLRPSDEEPGRAGIA